MSGIDLLHKATKSRKWKMKVDNSMKGVFGETDTATGVIKINKNLHKQKSGGHLDKNPNGTEKLLGTIVHELTHARHPRMHEKNVRKAEKRLVKKMSTRQKRRAYAMLDKGNKVRV